MTHAVLGRLLPQSTTAVVVVSSLAEGADRLVAEVVLELPGASLEVILPLPADDFLDDFESAESREQFWTLLERASLVHVVDQPPGESRPVAYERAGRELVDTCDVLIALWDGQASRGQGSTAELIQYALDHDVLVEVVLVERAAT